MFMLIVSCNQSSPGNIVLNASATHGKALAAVWCAGCHALPEPSLLSKALWQQKVLPYMGLRLGFHSASADSLLPAKDDADSTIFPNQKLITDVEWNDIIHYYISSAPASMQPQPKHVIPQLNATFFKPEFITVPGEKPGVCFVKIDTLQHSAQIVFADAFKKMYRLGKAFEVLDSVHVPGPIVDMSFTGVNNVYTNIGSIDPETEKIGNVGIFYINNNARPQYKILFDTLSRPVQTISADLNKDGAIDYIICEFGVYKGSLCWMENDGSNHFKKHVLVNLPGAIKAVVTDANKDGLPDIFVLMAQGDECVYLLTNKGNGTFESKQVLRFPAVYGSVSFELNDFNKDGYEDILYTCGDNADVSQVVKPYHGIYIFINDKTSHFRQSYFYPMNGCYKAMAADFNNDGYLDITAISFFTDYKKHPQDGFVYLHNNGNNNFIPYSIAETTKGRWLCMDVGDFDGDKNLILF